MEGDGEGLNLFRRLTLIQKFNIISLVLLVISSVVLGYWVSSQIESRVVERIGHTSSLFAGSVIAPSIRAMLEEETQSELQFGDLN